MDGREDDVAVARLDGIDAEQATAAPVARLDAEQPGRTEPALADLAEFAGHTEVDPALAAPVAEIGPDIGPEVEPDEASRGAVALFDADQLAGPTDNVRVVQFGGRRARRTRRSDRTSPDEPRDQAAWRRAQRDFAAPVSGASDERDLDGEATAGEERSRSRRRRPELDPDADPVTAAREICLRLLTDRARTRQELAQALRRRGVPDEAAGTVLERFDEVGLIDDAAFAGQWARSRHAQRGLARRAIAAELRRKGVSDEDAGPALAEVDAKSEERRARELVERKLRSITIATREQRTVAARRLAGMLARKGYGASVAYRVVKEVLAERGAEAGEFADAEPPDD